MSQQRINETLSREPNRWPKRIAIAGLVLLLIALSLPYVQFNKFSQDGLNIATKILTYFFQPQWDMLLNFTSTAGVPYLLLETMCIALLGTIIGAIISLPLAFLSSRNITGSLGSTVGVVIITIIRCIPALVYVLIFIQVETGPVAGILAFSITSVGMISKLFIEAIEELDKGILEALDSSGSTMFQKIRYGIIPQLKSNFLSTTIYRFEINVKNATILGMVGAGGIGAELIFAMNAFRWKDATTLLIGIIVLVIIIEQLSSWLRGKLING